ncbi:hypothetical protein LR48_Vigan11g145100 [Vigna angularis]|uniref:Uncharacterized protein n=1 Tax=Phaseolus angularis TaxID=3914 RepID=A0A0L9VU82_PHAAN|nr:hypothetical protein LR48_Vigan11g145100 [Vigna angularis]
MCPYQYFYHVPEQFLGIYYLTLAFVAVLRNNGRKRLRHDQNNHQSACNPSIRAIRIPGFPSPHESTSIHGSSYLSSLHRTPPSREDRREGDKPEATCGGLLGGGGGQNCSDG